MGQNQQCIHGDSLGGKPMSRDGLKDIFEEQYVKVEYAKHTLGYMSLSVTPDGKIPLFDLFPDEDEPGNAAKAVACPMQADTDEMLDYFRVVANTAAPDDEEWYDVIGLDTDAVDIPNEQRVFKISGESGIKYDIAFPLYAQPKIASKISNALTNNWIKKGNIGNEYNCMTMIADMRSDSKPWRDGQPAFCAVSALFRANCESIRKCKPAEVAGTRRLPTAAVISEGKNWTILTPDHLHATQFDPDLRNAVDALECNTAPYTTAPKGSNASSRVNVGKGAMSGDGCNAGGLGPESTIDDWQTKEEVLCCGALGKLKDGSNKVARTKKCGGPTPSSVAYQNAFYNKLKGLTAIVPALFGPPGEMFESYFYSLCCNIGGDAIFGNAHKRWFNPSTYTNRDGNQSLIHVFNKSLKDLVNMAQSNNNDTVKNWLGNYTKDWAAPLVSFDPVAGAGIVPYLNDLENIIAAGALTAEQGQRVAFLYRDLSTVAMQNWGSNPSTGVLDSGSLTPLYVCGYPHYYFSPSPETQAEMTARPQLDRQNPQNGTSDLEMQAAYQTTRIESFKHQNMDPSYICNRTFEKAHRQKFLQYFAKNGISDAGIDAATDGTVSIDLDNEIMNIETKLEFPRAEATLIYERKLLDNNGEEVKKNQIKERVSMEVDGGHITISMGRPGNKDYVSVSTRPKGQKKGDASRYTLPIGINVYQDKTHNTTWYSTGGLDFNIRENCTNGSALVIGTSGVGAGAPGPDPTNVPTLLVCQNQCANVARFSASPGKKPSLEYCNPFRSDGKTLPGCTEGKLQVITKEGVGEDPIRDGRYIYAQKPFGYYPLIMASPVLKYNLRFGWANDVGTCVPIGFANDGGTEKWLLKWEKGDFNAEEGSGEVKSDLKDLPYLKTGNIYGRNVAMCHLLYEKERTMNTFGTRGAGGGVANCANAGYEYASQAECETAKSAGDNVYKPFLSIVEEVRSRANEFRKDTETIDRLLQDFYEKIIKRKDEICELDTSDIDENQKNACTENFVLMLVPDSSHPPQEVLKEESLCLFRNSMQSK